MTCPSKGYGTRYKPSMPAGLLLQCTLYTLFNMINTGGLVDAYIAIDINTCKLINLNLFIFGNKYLRQPSPCRYFYFFQ